MKFVGSSFPTSSLSTGDDFLHTPTGAIYIFMGGDPSNPLNWRITGGQLQSDPDVTGWGENQKGAEWYNVPDQQRKMWNGTEIVLAG